MAGQPACCHTFWLPPHPKATGQTPNSYLVFMSLSGDKKKLHLTMENRDNSNWSYFPSQMTGQARKHASFSNFKHQFWPVLAGQTGQPILPSLNYHDVFYFILENDGEGKPPVPSDSGKLLSCTDDHCQRWLVLVTYYSLFKTIYLNALSCCTSNLCPKIFFLRTSAKLFSPFSW